MSPMSLVYLVTAVTLVTGLTAAACQPAQGIPFTPPLQTKAPGRPLEGDTRRGGITFTPALDQTVPRAIVSGGGAPIGGITFTPAPDQKAPRDTISGGGSRTGGITFTPAPDQKAPQDTTSGGGARDRQQCLQASTTDPTASPFVTALIPQNQYGLTLSARPTIFVYLPPNQAQQLFFSVKDETRQLHYQTTLPGVRQGGVVSISLPDTAPALVVGRNYQWYVALMCGGRLRTSSPLVDGWVKRIVPTPTLNRALATLSPLEQARTLGAAGVWYDTVAILADLWRAQPADVTIANHWRELMGSVALDDIAAARLSP